MSKVTLLNSISIEFDYLITSKKKICFFNFEEDDDEDVGDVVFIFFENMV